MRVSRKWGAHFLVWGTDETRVGVVETGYRRTGMQKRVVLDRSKTPDGEKLELAIEHGHHTIRVGGVPLMSSEMHGSEEAMAGVAKAELRDPKASRVLIGGLGMGFTLRAVLDAFDEDTRVCVAELMPTIVRYNREHLAELANRPLDDPRVTLFEGDVQVELKRGGYDVVLMDVDNGPDALTARSNKNLFTERGVRMMTDSVNRGGVLVLWSAYASPRFLEQLRSTGLSVRADSVRARWPLRKGPIHTLFVATRPR